MPNKNNSTTGGKEKPKPVGGDRDRRRPDTGKGKTSNNAPKRNGEGRFGTNSTGPKNKSKPE